MILIFCSIFRLVRKIIGARYFKLDGDPDPSDFLSPLDADGHGTHTSSTLAGDNVPNASLFGLAKGTSRGAVPSARVAMYKVCWISSGCSDIDILAAFDAAIHDGVDVISISIGGGSGAYTTDSIAIGSFHAMNNGIITVTSAGNDGPSLGSVANHAPWLLTVAASGIDRAFKSQVQFGDGKSILVSFTFLIPHVVILIKYKIPLMAPPIFTPHFFFFFNTICPSEIV